MLLQGESARLREPQGQTSPKGIPLLRQLGHMRGLRLGGTPHSRLGRHMRGLRLDGVPLPNTRDPRILFRGEVHPILAAKMGPRTRRMVWKNHFSDLPFFEGYPFERAENIDIESQVRNGQFRTKNPTRNGREIAICPTKKHAD